MRRWLRTLSRPVITLSVLVLLAPVATHATPKDAEVRAQLGGLRLPFIANEGQVDARVAYYAPTFAGTLFVTRQGELVYSLPARSADTPRGRRRPSSSSGWSLTETLVGGRAQPAAQARSAAGVSYFFGRDPSDWRPHVSTYEQVSLGEVWPGVTAALLARGRSIEKVFTVQPGAPVERIRVSVRGAEALSVTPEGALVARTGRGDVTFTAPVAYQERDGKRHNVALAYHTQGTEYGFSVEAYDRSLPLVIDPLLQSTYLGGSQSEFGFALAIHPVTGDVYVGGFTDSTNFPGTFGGAQIALGGTFDGFVARLNTSLTGLLQATYLGGSLDDYVYALAIHPTTGDVYAVGATASSNFPHTGGGAQVIYNGGPYDAFVTRFPSTLGAITQATYLGAGGDDEAEAIAIHPATGDVYVTGFTNSTNFPVAAGGAQPLYNGGPYDAYVARFLSTLTSIVQTTYLGGSGDDEAYALAIHPTTGDVYVAGLTNSANLPVTAGGAQPVYGGGAQDAFVARLSSTLTAIVQVTYLGGGAQDQASSLAIHPVTGDVYVAGFTASTNFPGTAGGAQPNYNGGAYDAFVARLVSTLKTIIQSTYLGAGGDDEAYALAIHPGSGDVFVAGFTNSSNFPAVAGAAQAVYGGGYDAVVARLPRSLATLTQATYLGGSGDDFAFAFAIDPTTGNVYAAGFTFSTNFPATAGGAQPANAGQTDAFVARLTSSLKLSDFVDLTITKTHTGSFYRGQVDATYRLTVSNAGSGTTAGAVVVTDTLPTGLTATALGGSGWSCTLGTLTCSRSNPLADGASYPVITLTVTVAGNAPGSVTNAATVSGGGDGNTGNNTANDPTSITTFTDVPAGHPFQTWIEALAKSGLTGGCVASPPQYCPDTQVTRDQMAVLLLRGVHGATYQPPAATGTMFTDVPVSHPFASWIEQLARERITGGCSTSPPQYCPAAAVTRAQMAVFLLRAKHGSSYQPPPATGMFADVPVGNPFAAWIDQLAREGITGGCGTNPARYCPDDSVTRGQMAVFLVRTFNLPL